MKLPSHKTKIVCTIALTSESPAVRHCPRPGAGRAEPEPGALGGRCVTGAFLFPQEPC